MSTATLTFGGTMSSPRRALVIIDVQQEYFDGPLAIQYPDRDQSLARIVDVVGFAAVHGVPIAVIQHESAPGSPIFAPGSARQAIRMQNVRDGQPTSRSNLIASATTAQD